MGRPCQTGDADGVAGAPWLGAVPACWLLRLVQSSHIGSNPLYRVAGGTQPKLVVQAVRAEVLKGRTEQVVGALPSPGSSAPSPEPDGEKEDVVMKQTSFIPSVKTT